MNSTDKLEPLRLKMRFVSRDFDSERLNDFVRSLPE